MGIARIDHELELWHKVTILSYGLSQRPWGSKKLNKTQKKIRFVEFRTSGLKFNEPYDIDSEYGDFDLLNNILVRMLG